MKYDFKNPEHWAELEQQAFHGTVDVSCFPPAAYRYFSELMKLYSAYKENTVSKDDAANRKRILLWQYEQTVQAYDGWKQVHTQYQDAIRTAGTLLSEINKAQTAESIAAIACKVIGLMTGDSSFYPLQMRKLEQIASKQRHDAERGKYDEQSS